MLTNYLLPAHPIWADLLADELQKPYFKELRKFLLQEFQEGKQVLPTYSNIFRAFDLCHPLAAKVVIVGDEPSTTPSVGNGLAFSTHSKILKDSLPSSLRNIYRELKMDLGIENKYGDLTFWAHQGVLLMNRCLTARAGESKAHFNKGWETYTDAAVLSMLSLQQPQVYMLWGAKAQELMPLLVKHGKPGKLCILISESPNPGLASKGFFFQKHFSQANSFLIQNDREHIDWRL